MLEKVFLRTSELAAQAVTSPPAFSGLKDLDKLILDWQRPLLVVVTGESGAGRSALAGQIAAHCATNEQAVVYSIDLPAHTVVVRLITSRGHIDATRILSGQANDRDWERMAQAAGWLSEQDIDVVNAYHFSVDQIVADALARHQGRPVNLVVIDGVELLEHLSELRHQKRRLLMPPFSQMFGKIHSLRSVRSK